MNETAATRAFGRTLSVILIAMRALNAISRIKASGLLRDWVCEPRHRAVRGGPLKFAVFSARV